MDSIKILENVDSTYASILFLHGLQKLSLQKWMKPQMNPLIIRKKESKFCYLIFKRFTWINFVNNFWKSILQHRRRLIMTVIFFGYTVLSCLVLNSRFLYSYYTESDMNYEYSDISFSEEECMQSGAQWFWSSMRKEKPKTKSSPTLKSKTLSMLTCLRYFSSLILNIPDLLKCNFVLVFSLIFSS